MQEFESSWAEWKADPDFDGPERKTIEILEKFGIEARVERSTSRSRDSGIDYFTRHYRLFVKIPEKGNAGLMKRLGEIGYIRLHKSRTIDEWGHGERKKYSGYAFIVTMCLEIKSIYEGDEAGCQ